MDLSSPISSVIPSAHGAVLAVLARTDVQLSGRRVAALTDGAVSSRRTSEVLNELTEAGVVICEVNPPAKLYRLNRNHLAAGAIENLARMRERLLTQMRQEIESWEIPVQAAWLFGSTARGDGGVDSDIDVLVLRSDSVDADAPAWDAQLERLVDHVAVWTGNHCEILVYSDVEFDGLLCSGERLVAELRRDGLHIAGEMVDTRTRRRAA